MKLIISLALLGLFSLPPGESLRCYQCPVTDPKCDNASQLTQQDTVVCGSLERSMKSHDLSDENEDTMQDVQQKWQMIVDLLMNNGTLPTVSQLKEAWMKMDQVIRANDPSKVRKNFYVKVMDEMNQTHVLKSLKTLYETFMNIMDLEEIGALKDEVVKDIIKMRKTPEETKRILIRMNGTEQSKKIATLIHISLLQLDASINRLTYHSEKSEILSLLSVFTILKNQTSLLTAAKLREKLTELIPSKEELRLYASEKVVMDFYVKAVNKINQTQVLEALEILCNTIINIVNSKEGGDALQEMMKMENDEILAESKVLEKINEIITSTTETEEFLKVDELRQIMWQEWIKRVMSGGNFICYIKIHGDYMWVSRGCMDASDECDENYGCFACNSDYCN